MGFCNDPPGVPVGLGTSEEFNCLFSLPSTLLHPGSDAPFLLLSLHGFFFFFSSPVCCPPCSLPGFSFPSLGSSTDFSWVCGRHPVRGTRKAGLCQLQQDCSVGWTRGDLAGREGWVCRICPSSMIHAFQPAGSGEGDLINQKIERGKRDVVPAGECCRALAAIPSPPWCHGDSVVFLPAAEALLLHRCGGVAVLLDAWHPFCSSSHCLVAPIHPWAVRCCSTPWFMVTFIFGY